MDYTMQQWRDQQRLSDQQPSAKIPKLLLEQQQQQHQSSGSPLSLSVLEQNSKSCCNLSAFPDSAAARFPRMGGFFSLAQWQELELQALIFKYMLAGASVPSDLVHLIRKSLLSTPFYQHLHHQQQYQHFQPAMSQTGYWGRTVVDAEPGRCRRTDGKKWRCSREVVTGHKYCERHVHRGRNRSRKPVEIPTPTATGGLKSTVTFSSSTAEKETHFALLGPPLPHSNDLLHLNQRSSDGNTETGSHLPNHQHSIAGEEGRSEGRVLRHFFDDWPRSQQDSSSAISSNASPTTSSTHLSISTPGNPSSDFSLKLSTGNLDEMGHASGNAEERQRNWTMGWGTHQEASMGGPLAEALRSSTSTSSPTSVLHKPYASISEASSICT